MSCWPLGLVPSRPPPILGPSRYTPLPLHPSGSPPPPPCCPLLRAATLNVNGLASNVEDVTALLSLDNLDCILLQEALLRPRYRLPGFPDYRPDFHAYGDRVASELGCYILVVRDHLWARLVGHSTPGWLSVRLESRSPHTPALILTSIYLPSGSQLGTALYFNCKWYIC